MNTAVHEIEAITRLSGVEELKIAVRKEYE